ncbi:MAG TPA: hypothetical protein PLO63_01600 [Syntrophales bacterium]|nr:hypothetical protein [Syntrophales bacterium]
MIADHSFLFEEGLWGARGYYIDSIGVPYPVEGESRITHEGDSWINDSWMRIPADPPVEYRNRYVITPFEEGTDCTAWISDNPALGRLRGTFVLVDDAILSVYGTEDGRLRGSEALFRVSSIFYRGRGCLMEGEKKISSWSVELKRRESGTR